MQHITHLQCDRASTNQLVVVFSCRRSDGNFFHQFPETLDTFYIHYF